ncbi:MAG: response regulator, partial [Cephaloticoccus sp.]|nr:response regulator [Cephaloticoccus sp.]
VVPLRRATVKSTVAAEDLRATASNYPRRILLAEDNVVNRKLALAMLGHLGYAPDNVVNGQRALEACRQKTYDLVFMDVQMPEMDGLEACRQIRQLPGPQPVIIAMTANAMLEDRDKCSAAGMDDYLSKPVKLEDLRRMILATHAMTEGKVNP